MALPLAQLYHWEKTEPNRAFLHQPQGEEWTVLSWSAAAGEVRRMAAALKALNLPEGSRIAILSKNSAHWLLADFAIWMSGHVSVPLYPNSNAATVRQILEHSDTQVVFVGHLDDPSLVDACPASLPRIYLPRAQGPAERNWYEVLAKHAPLMGEIARGEAELATIIYTSGTTGHPKGVMHSFGNIAHAGIGIREANDLNPRDIFFSYLPLAHVAERLVVETAVLYSGGQVFFTESLERFAANLKYVQPTVFLAVPRIWLKFQQGILAKLPQKKLSLLLRTPVLGRLLAKKLRYELGLSRARLAITGAAPIPTSTIDWFQTIGIEMQEAYAMSENFAYSHYSPPGNTRVGAVGRCLPRVEQEIGVNGEVRIASPANMIGYYRDPEASALALDGRFLCTGDMGAIDEEGFLRLTGRVKELFKTSKGKYVAPAPIESRFGRCTLVEQVCVVGAGFPQPFALVTLSETSRQATSEAVTEELDAVRTSLNEDLPAHEQLSNVVVLRESWTIENGALTPTMKIRRSEIEARYAQTLADWSYHPQTVVWHE